MTNDVRTPQISMHRIPVGRGWQAGLLVLLLLTGMAIELPGVRTAVVGAAAGIPVGLLLIWWRRR